MVKKDRLGSDPLSWIGGNSDSEQPKKTEKPKPQNEPVSKAPAATSTPSGPTPVKETPPPKGVEKPAPEPEKTVVAKEEKAQPAPQKPAEVKKRNVDTSIQNTSKSLLSKNRDVQKDSRSSDIKKNLELEGKYLTFVLAEEDYGIEITKVKEIMGLLPITRVPRTIDYIKGVINLRGKIVSVIDMRIKFGMDQIPTTQETCIIVVQTRMGEKGIIVDKVSEVLNIFADDIESVPAFGTNIDTHYILGMAKVDDNVKILLDIEKILSTIQSVGKEA